MILYRLLEEQPIKVQMERDETFLKAVLRGARPPLTDKSRKFHPAIQRLWSDDPTLYSLDKLIQYFENPENWIPGVDADAFWRYKAYVDYEQEKRSRFRLSDCAFRKLNDRGACERAFAAGQTPIEKLARLLEWLNGTTNKSGDLPSYDAAVQSLREHRRLDPAAFSTIDPPPKPLSLFTTSLLDIESLTEGKKIEGGRLLAKRSGDPTEYALKRVPVSEAQNLAQFISGFLREVIGFSLGHPALARLVGWNASPQEVYLLTEYPSEGTLKISPAPSTPPRIILYGIARGLEFLHTTGFVHGSLTSDSILLDGRLRPVIADLGFSVPIGPSAYTSPEVLNGAAPTPASDVYSFGIIAYELIEGVRAVPGTRPAFSRIGGDLATFFA
jgi:hypothetical protein